MLETKKGWTRLLAAAAVMVPGMALAAGECGSGEVSFLALITPNLTAEIYLGLIDRFNDQHPDITIQMIQSSGQPHEEYARLLLSTGSFPDVAGSLNIDRASFFRPDVLAPLPLDDDAQLIRNVESETTDGDLFAYTPFSQPISLVFYNKAMFEAAGITEDMLPPANMAEFEAMLYQVRDEGMVPMAVANSWAAGWAFFQLTQPTVFLESPEWYIERAEGAVTFADGTWERGAERFVRWAADGIFDPDALSTDYASGQGKFLAGDAATWVMGSFFTAAAGDQDFEIGVFPVPTETGEQVINLRTDPNSISVSVTADPMAAAICFAKFMALDQESNKTLAEADGLFSNLAVPPALELTDLQKQIADYIASLPSLPTALGRGSSQPVAGLTSEYTAVAEAMLQGSMTAAEAMAQLDDYWESQSE